MNVGDDELRAACRERLSRYKVPKEFRLVRDLPRNRMGKIDRRALREQGGQGKS
jgi:acyl-coenzyme A synthetase/AMP-(fatty) acid ligase